MSRRLLEQTLRAWGHEVVATKDGDTAWTALQAPGAPCLAILDWMMPGIDGIEICRRLRQDEVGAATYIILLTARDNKNDIVVGLEAGADYYIIKPFDTAELQARLNVGIRVVRMQQVLGQRVRELEAAMANVKQLHGLLPMCSWCRRIRDDRNYWQSVEDYVTAHSHANFTHGICPDCKQQHFSPARELAVR